MSKETSKLASVFKQLKDFDVEPVDLNKIQDIPRWRISTPSHTSVVVFQKGVLLKYMDRSQVERVYVYSDGFDVQNRRTVVYIDMECSFEVCRTAYLNCSDNFILLQPKTGEDVFNIIRKVAETGEVALIIADSVSAMVPKAELEGMLAMPSWDFRLV